MIYYMTGYFFIALVVIFVVNLVFRLAASDEPLYLQNEPRDAAISAVIGMLWPLTLPITGVLLISSIVSDKLEEKM